MLLKDMQFLPYFQFLPQLLLRCLLNFYGTNKSICLLNTTTIDRFMINMSFLSTKIELQTYISKMGVAIYVQCCKLGSIYLGI